MRLFQYPIQKNCAANPCFLPCSPFSRSSFSCFSNSTPSSLSVSVLPMGICCEYCRQCTTLQSFPDDLFWINVYVLIIISVGRYATEFFCLAPLCPPIRQPPFVTALPSAMQSLGMVDTTLGSFAHDWKWFEGCKNVYHSPVGYAHRISREPLVQRSHEGPYIQSALRGSMAEVLRGVLY